MKYETESERIVRRTQKQSHLRARERRAVEAAQKPAYLPIEGRQYASNGERGCERRKRQMASTGL